MSEYNPVPPSSAPQVAPNSNLALFSFIAGILGLTLFPFLASIVAVVTGPMARREIRDSGGAIGGEGLATAGIVLGWIGIALGLLGICGLGTIFLVPFCLLLFNTDIHTSGMLLPIILSLI